jgi:hypothetical protein
MLDKEATYVYGEGRVKTSVILGNMVGKMILGTTETHMNDERDNAVIMTTIRVLEDIHAMKDSVDSHYAADVKASARKSHYRTYDDLYMRYTGIFGGFGDPMDREIAVACLFKNHNEAKFTLEAYTELTKRLMKAIEENPLKYSYFPYAKYLLSKDDE